MGTPPSPGRSVRGVARLREAAVRSERRAVAR